MIPILFNAAETSFTTNGVGRLAECISCTVTEERNGVYECEFQYPITGRRYSDIVEGMYIFATHDDTKVPQPFEIYGRTAPINGVVTFYAHHISYKLNNIVVDPFTATSAADAFSQINNKSINTNPFTFWTDVITAGNFSLDAPSSVRGMLGGVRGSILDVYGGEYEFDRLTVKLHAARGISAGVTIRYGKNLTDLKQEIDNSNTYDAVVPYWKQESDLVMLDEKIVSGSNGSNRLAVLDLTNEFQEKPTKAQLKSKAQSKLNTSRPWIPSENIKINFVALWQTTQYKDVASLQRVRLCDTVNVYYPALGVTAENVKVIKTKYNVLLDRYDSMELGDARSSFAETVIKKAQEGFGDATRGLVNRSALQAAIDYATQMITGGLGGHVVFTLNANGEPEEILVMDTDDVGTAVNVLRINQNGIGFSTNGYNGPFTTAWTIDGHFNADFITTGHIVANMILGGTLTLGGANNGNGVMHVLNASGLEISKLDNTGLEFVNETREYDSYTSSYFRKSTKITSGALELSRINDSTSEKTVVGNLGPTSNGIILSSHKPASYDSTAGITFRAGLTRQNGTTVSRQFKFYLIDWGDDNVGIKSHLQLINVDLIDIGGTNQGCLNFSDGYQIGYRSNFKVGRYVASYPYSGNDFKGFRWGWSGDIYIDNCSLQVGTNGTKSKLFNSDKQARAMYCYETPTPYFGDIGCGQTDGEGICYVQLDEIFKDSVNTGIQYQVFLQKEGDGDIWVHEKTREYFVVKGTSNLSFSWEVKAKQTGFESLRMEVSDTHEMDFTSDEPDYMQEGQEEFYNYIQEVTS